MEHAASIKLPIMKSIFPAAGILFCIIAEKFSLLGDTLLLHEVNDNIRNKLCLLKQKLLHRQGSPYCFALVK